MTLEEKIFILEEKLEELKGQLEKEKKNKINKGDLFFFLNSIGTCKEETFNNCSYHNSLLQNYNAFKDREETKKHIEWYRDNIVKIHNRLMQLHEELCPNYFPNWKNESATKYTVFLDTRSNKWKIFSYSTVNFFTIYFPSIEVAQTVCEILNKEKFMFKEEE